MKIAVTRWKEKSYEGNYYYCDYLSHIGCNLLDKRKERRQDMNNDLISREALKEKLSLYPSITKFNSIHDGILAEIIDNAPTVDAIQYTLGYQDGFLEGKKIYERPQGDFTRSELESWLYRIASNNLDNELGRYCEEIICRLNGFERFVSDMRKGDAV